MPTKETIGLILAFAILVEALIEAIIWTIEDFTQKRDVDRLAEDTKGWNKQRILAMVVSIVMCVLFEIDVFAEFGFHSKVPYVAFVMTGVIGARGSNVVHDVIQLIKAIRL